MTMVNQVSETSLEHVDPNAAKEYLDKGILKI